MIDEKTDVNLMSVCLVYGAGGDEPSEAQRLEPEGNSKPGSA